jgi:hypothetical protein
MHSIEVINRLPPPSARHLGSATPSIHASDFNPPSIGERLDEILPLIDVIPEAGPPVIFILGPWLVFVLMLIGPFLLLFTLALAAVIFVAIAVAILTPPYLFVRHVRKAWLRRAQLRGTAPCTPRSFSSTAPSPNPQAGTVSSTRCSAPIIQ